MELSAEVPNLTKYIRWAVRRFAGPVSYSYLTYYDQDEEIELARLEWKYLLVLSFGIVGCFGIGVGLHLDNAQR